MDGDGRALPYIENDRDANGGTATIEYIASGEFSSGIWSGRRVRVPASEIEVRFEGMDEFLVQADD